MVLESPKCESVAPLQDLQLEMIHLSILKIYFYDKPIFNLHSTFKYKTVFFFA